MMNFNDWKLINQISNLFKWNGTKTKTKLKRVQSAENGILIKH